ncbi:MAG: nucleotidyltransferase family protein [Acholeplasma sp.]|jgi:molybdenum cofactor cytidylyltransferase|nr:MAG: nucleotidyltransferase family protein [Acholeplasma sp.]
MAQGVILAAGYSSRAQSNKMLFKIQEKTLLEHAIDGMRPYVTHIFIVTGHDNDTISSLVKYDPMVTCVFNADYDKGMFSSIKKGVFMTHEDSFLLPGDCPFVAGTTYEALLQCSDDLCVPSYHEQRGHPLLIRYAMIKRLKREPSDGTLKHFRNRMGFETIPVEDPNILVDIDTQEIYEEIKRLKEE